MKMYYVAEDGTKFDTEDECLEYVTQADIKRFGNDIMLLDANFKQITTDGCGFRDCIYLRMCSENAERLAESVYHNFGYEIPSENGFYYYDCTDDCYVSIDELVNICADKITMLTKAKNIMKGFENKNV